MSTELLWTYLSDIQRAYRPRKYCAADTPSGRFDIRADAGGIDPYTAWLWKPSGSLVYIGAYRSAEAAREACRKHEGVTA